MIAIAKFSKGIIWPLALLVTIAAWTTSASAHSPLIATNPVENAIVVGSPETIMLDFKGDIRLTRVNVKIEGGNFAPIDLAGHKSFASDFVLALPDLGNGKYVIEWRGLGADGHALTGTFSFTVE